jgi:beta-1,4-mannosyl-glycoprotein beta-1,4-N-acetylglucosaminyltransferase
MKIDVFPYNGESDVLALRLGQLNDVVDWFVLVETDLTFSGISKPYYYKENKHLFEQYNHKIVSASVSLRREQAWTYEKSQREVLVSLIQGLNPQRTDTVTFSDCDEIPNPESIKNYTYDLGLRNLKQHTYYYTLNHCFDYGNRSWSRARIGSVGHILDHGMMGFRGGWPAGKDLDPNFPAIEQGGWHLSYFRSTIDDIRKKVFSISHDDLWPFIRSRTDKQIADDVVNGRDLYHRAGIGDAVWVDTDVDSDPRLPPYFLQNKERFGMFTDKHFREVNKHLFD